MLLVVCAPASRAVPASGMGSVVLRVCVLFSLVCACFVVFVPFCVLLFVLFCVCVCSFLCFFTCKLPELLRICKIKNHMPFPARPALGPPAGQKQARAPPPPPSPTQKNGSRRVFCVVLIVVTVTGQGRTPSLDLWTLTVWETVDLPLDPHKPELFAEGSTATKPCEANAPKGR